MHLACICYQYYGMLIRLNQRDISADQMQSAPV